MYEHYLCCIFDMTLDCSIDKFIQPKPGGVTSNMSIWEKLKETSFISDRLLRSMRASLILKSRRDKRGDKALFLP